MREEILVIIRREAMPAPYNRTGFVYRAYYEDGVPLYIGEETPEATKRRVLDFYPDAQVTLDESGVGG